MAHQQCSSLPYCLTFNAVVYNLSKGEIRNCVKAYLAAMYLIVVLNVCEVGSLSKAWSLVEVSQVWPDIRVVHNPLLVTLHKK